MIMINKGNWWYPKSKIKFNLNKFFINDFEDLKKIFKFKNQNFKIYINNIELKKIGYNFFLNKKRVRKKDIIKLLSTLKKGC